MSTWRLPIFTKSGINPFPIALNALFEITIVPVPSVTISSAPLNTSIAARDATKAGIPIFATKNPVKVPVIVPNTRTKSIVTGTDTLNLIISIAAIAPRNPAKNPTDKSMCFITITRVIPTASTAIYPV